MSRRKRRGQLEFQISTKIGNMKQKKGIIGLLGVGCRRKTCPPPQRELLLRKRVPISDDENRSSAIDGHS
jgi:hypothetical protein